MLENLQEMINQHQVPEIWKGLTKANKLNVGEGERLASLLGGGPLILYGLGQRSFSGIGFVLTGGYLIYRGLAGHCPAYEALQISTVYPKLRFDDEYNEQPETTIDPEDIVDETIWGTFPASDPTASW